MKSIRVLVILGAFSFVSVFANAENRKTGSTVNSNMQADKRISKTTSDKLRGGLHFNIGIPVPKVPVPDPWVGVEQHLDYWPYKKYHELELSSVIRGARKLFWYLWELSTLGIRILFQLFDFFQMKKSFDALGPSEGWKDDDDWKRMGRLLTNPSSWQT